MIELVQHQPSRGRPPPARFTERMKRRQRHGFAALARSFPPRALSSHRPPFSVNVSPRIFSPESVSSDLQGWRCVRDDARLRSAPAMNSSGPSPWLSAPLRLMNFSPLSQALLSKSVGINSRSVADFRAKRKQVLFLAQCGSNGFGLLENTVNGVFFYHSFLFFPGIALRKIDSVRHSAQYPPSDSCVTRIQAPRSLAIVAPLPLRLFACGNLPVEPADFLFRDSECLPLSPAKCRAR